MRISAAQQEVLTKAVRSLRPDAEIYLFGSRTNDEGRGGDIDILILCKPKMTLQEKWKVELTFHRAFGEQKIDLLSFEPDEDQPMKRIALRNAIPL